MSLIIKDGMYKNCPVIEIKVINYRVYGVVLSGADLILIKEPRVIPAEVKAKDEAVKKPTTRKKAE